MRIWHQSLSEKAPTLLDSVKALPTGLTLDCRFFGFQKVNIYVIDEFGNYDFCITEIEVQDNMSACSSGESMVGGKIYTPYGEAVERTEVNVANTSMMTQSDGNYQFMLGTGGSYRITPQKDINVMNGISTFDLVKISKHILGKEEFTSPYQYIAADINRSGDVTTLDIVQLRKLILNITQEFPNDNTSWRFVDASYEFKTDKPLEEDFREYIEISNLSASQPNMDFIAVKVGDINGNAMPNSLLAAESRHKEGNFLISVEDRFVQKGEIVEVVFLPGDLAAIEGYQFTFKYEGLDLVSFHEGIAKANNFGFALQNRGILTASWNDLRTTPTKSDEVLFALTFEAKTSDELLSLLEINSDYTQAEAYGKDGTLLNVGLRPLKVNTLTSNIVLRQNQPNPFQNHTLIDFELPQAMSVQLNIINTQGKVVQAKSGVFEAGQHQFLIEANGLQTGTYYYQLVTDLGVETKKMIKVF